MITQHTGILTLQQLFFRAKDQKGRVQTTGTCQGSRFGRTIMARFVLCQGSSVGLISG